MNRRIIFDNFGWSQIELLPRIRISHNYGSFGVGFGWMVWWLHIWLKMPPERQEDSAWD